MIKIVIFDFDGTIADTKSIYYNVMNKHLNALGFTKKQVDRAIDLGMNVAETVRKFVPSRIYAWFIKKKIMKDVVIEVNNVRKCRDIYAINDIRARKVLISNSLEEFVTPIIKHLKIAGYFDEIYCADDFHDKEDFIKKYLRVEGINPNKCIYVGDRVADVKASKKIGCYSIIVLGKCAWDSRKEIAKAEPDFIINDLKELKNILRKFNSA